MRFKYVEVKTKTGKHKVMFTEDMKFFKGTDMIKALGNRFIYSIGVVLGEHGITLTKEMRTPEGNRMFGFMEIEKLFRIEEVLGAMFPEDEKGKRNFPSDKRGYYQSQLIALRDFRQMLVDSKININGEEIVEEEKEVVVEKTTVQNRINNIFDELLKLSEEVGDGDSEELEKLTTELDSAMALGAKIAKELTEAKANLEKVTSDHKALAKEGVMVKEQLSLSEAKYEELKNVNLSIIKQRDALKAENEELARFKSNIETLIRK
ncbi:MAG: hypothetical protein ACRCZ1_01035 [Cetobacterium sp.]